MTDLEKKYLPAEPIVAWGAFLILLVCYWLTVPPTVSFWDCPEYVSAAYLLEVGHPPGNPVWMLVERIVTLCVPPQYAALAINLSSGVFMAFAAFFLAKTIFRVGLWVLLKLPHRRIPAPLGAARAALTGALAFGFCDSAWYSAVEAEVYAMSMFMSALCVWLMTKWAGTRNRGQSWRLLVLIAYLFGLSIGIHQLNLLCIPALAMIWAVRRGIRSTGRLVFIFFLAVIAVGCVLVGMMPSTIALAAEFELFATNTLHLPALWGVAIYIAALAASLAAALLAVGRFQHNRVVMAVANFPAIFLSGIFIISEHFLIGAIISAVVAVALVLGSNFQARRLYLAMWMLAMLLTGYSSYAIIPIRGSIPSPANGAMPDQPFSFAAYQSREQYGAKPLLYGPTPYSRNLLREDISPEGRPVYSRFAFDYTSPAYVPKEKGARMRSRINGLSEADSARNARVLSRDGDGYIIKSMRFRPLKTPELDIWFPRITGSSPGDLESYSEWIGMDTASMTRVQVSEVIDSLGNPAGRVGRDGKRSKAISYRPTYLQNLQWFLSYQTAYMYWRYLMWNFVGRQNDRPAQGEVQHGNFITGFTPVDNAMLGAEDHLPPVAGKDNRGRNRYFGLPLLLGILGIVWLLKGRKRGKQTLAITAILFVMSGLAITVYLNQGPGEPRERDYSFLGSYWAFAVWIGFGALLIARRLRSVWAFLIPLAVPVWMAAQNFDDHDRSGREAARWFAHNFLNSLQHDAVLFVNGDNYTFPLWYAQEVEGVRTDVRVINLAYLQTPVYTANLLRQWRESPPLATTLTRGDIIWDAFARVRFDRYASDTIPAVEALRRLRFSSEPCLEARFVSIPAGDGSDFILDLSNLSAGTSHIDFMKLMMLDIVATNADSPAPRPVYWLGALGADKRIGLTQATSPWLFGYEFGRRSDAVTDSLLRLAAGAVRPLNPVGRNVYMDRAPSMMTGATRGPLVAAARRLLDHGDPLAAADIARKADLLMGEAPDSYIPMIIGDTLFRVHHELGLLLVDCGESLRIRARDSLITPYMRKKLDTQGIELKARGLMHIRHYTERRDAWTRYRAKLPPRLQPKMAPVY